MSKIPIQSEKSTCYKSIKNTENQKKVKELGFTNKNNSNIIWNFKFGKLIFPTNCNISTWFTEPIF